MTEPYIEDDGAEFPINNYVQCGQTEYVASFGEDQAKVLKIKTKACRVLKGKFLPKLTEPARQVNVPASKPRHRTGFFVPGV